MMKEFKMEDINPVNAITNKLWSLFDNLRYEIPSEDYHVILFLLSLYKDGYLDEEVISSQRNVKEILKSKVKSSEGDLREQYIKIYEAFDLIINRISDEGLVAIIQTLKSINLKVLTNHFPEIFDNIIYGFAKSQGRKGDVSILPFQLSRFICGLVDLPKDASVFNPFAGLASFGIFLDKGQSYFGQEINFTSWALGILRIMAYERPGSSTFVKDDSIMHWPSEEQKFDLIVSAPPLGLRLDKLHYDISYDIRSVECYLLKLGIPSLSKNGKLIAVLPGVFFFRDGSEQKLRKELIDSDLIELIIALPGGMLYNTGIPLVILVINKDKKLPGKVKFIDASNFFDSRGHLKVLNDYALNSAVNRDEETDSLRVISNEQIRSLHYNLSVARYFQKEYEGNNLGDILKLIPGNKSNLPKTGKLVKIRDLKNDSLDCFLDHKIIPETELNRQNIYAVEESCLLLAIRWTTIKPTYFKFEGQPLYLTTDIFAFKVDESKANMSFLINELHSENVNEQLDSYRLGGTIPILRIHDLLKVMVKLPSLEEQIGKVKGLVELSTKIKILQQEKNALAHGLSSSQFNEFASLKHTLGRPRQNILDWSDNLIDFLSNKSSELEVISKAFAAFYDMDIIAALKEIKRDVNFMSEILEKGENGLVLSEHLPQLISLSDFNSIIDEFTTNGFKFKLKKYLLNSEELNERGIECNTALLKTLIDNILTNANKHAFIKNEATNELVIELSEVEDQLILEIKNNGNPFPKNFDKEKFASKYSTANPREGSGLGGYDINRIATYFNNPDWELILNEDPIYPVKFKFQFPINLIK